VILPARTDPREGERMWQTSPNENNRE